MPKQHRQESETEPCLDGNAQGDAQGDTHDEAFELIDDDSEQAVGGATTVADGDRMLWIP